MAIIVKVEMPDCCGYDCDLWSEGICVPLQKVVDTHTRDHDCPIIGEIPNEHGRLIDADELRMEYEYGENRKKVDNAPTVIEASKE